MQIIPITPIDSMFGKVNDRAGYYIRRSPMANSIPLNALTEPVMSKLLPKQPTNVAWRLSQR